MIDSPIARAQACHMPDLHRDPQRQFRAAARVLFANYDTTHYTGEYQGYGASFSYTHPWVYAEVALSGYRLVRNKVELHGIGDLALDLRGTLWQHEQLTAGIELAATLPTGSQNKGLGMGHVMLMPGAWLSFRTDHLSVVAQLAYGRAISDGSGAHAHHSGAAPLVNPMNRSEIEHAISVSYSLSSQVFAGARLLGAVPVAAAGGQAREVFAVAVGAICGPVVVDLEQQLPIEGAPFHSRTVLSAAAQF